MPRTGGVYSEPAGTKGVSGQTIQSVPYNTFIDDLVTDANAARPVTAGGTGATTASGARTNLGVGNFVDADAVQTLTNKSLQDSTTYIIDNGDTTKKVQFQVSGVATATTRTWTFPDASDTFVGLAATQSLTNKTLDDSTTFFADNGDTSKKLQFQLSGISASTTRTLTAPDLSGSIIVDAGAQTVTGLKTFSVGNATTSQSFAEFTPTDYVTGKPKLAVQKSATASQWNFLLFDGTNNAGTINFTASTGLTWNGNQLVDVATQQTISALKTVSVNTATTQAAYVTLSPTDFGPGKPNFVIRKPTTATQWDILLFDGSGSTGTINVISTGFTWNGVQIVDLSSVQTLTNKTLTSPTIAGGALSGTFSGTPTYSGLPIISLNTATTATDYLELKPTDFGPGKPMLAFNKTATASLWNISLWDGTNAAGTINFNSTTGLNWNGVQLVDLSSSQTLTTKTLTSPTINGATLTGTISGGTHTSATLTSPTINGATISGTFAGSATFSGTLTITRPSITLQDSTTTFQDDGDNTKQFRLQLSSVSTATTRTWTVPDSDDTFVGLAATQTLTNKSLTSPTLTGTPTAPTAAGGTNTTQVATTAFVMSAFGTGGYYAPSNILGTVSQSGGVPTGSIIERGSNANGEYVKFADGTMICTFVTAGQTSTTVAGSVFTSGVATWTFPVAFAAAPSVHGSAESAARWANANATSASAGQYAQFSYVSSAGSIAVELMAVGRWF